MKEADKKTSPPSLCRIAVAPMIDWTDRHCRFFHRLLAPHALLYTEMITSSAILHGNRDRLLGFSPAEHPLTLQLGGSDPQDLALCAKIVKDFGYDALNLNCGCPSERVQKGSFGACLMAEPDLVASCVQAMNEASPLPVSVKCRIGIDDSDDFPFLDRFISTVKAAGCDTFIIHARKAWLKGLSPKENREIPPLRYDLAAQIKQTHPDLTIWLNGGLKTLSQIEDALSLFDGVMIGREAYQNPWFLAEVENYFYGTPIPNRFDIARKMATYIGQCHTIEGTPIHSITRHMIDLFSGERGARFWRQKLGAEATRAASPLSFMEDVLIQMDKKISSETVPPEGI